MHFCIFYTYTYTSINIQVLFGFMYEHTLLPLWVRATHLTDVVKTYCLKSCKQLAAWIFLDCYQDFRCDRLFSIALKDVIKVYVSSSDLLNLERTSL